MNYRDPAELKEAVREHWNAESCGTRDLATDDRARFFADLEHERYALEPYIRGFARFEEGRGKSVLEVGVGAGTDFVNWVRHGARATGIDLTAQGVALTRERLLLEGLEGTVTVADAEALPFDDESFDLVYSYGVLHHSPDTARAVGEAWRVLKPGGRARVMIYHTPSWAGLVVWAVHCAAKGKPWKSPRWAVYHHLESPGTKAYTVAETQTLFAKFSSVDIKVQLSHADLLKMRPSSRYRMWYHKLAWKIYPRPLIEATGNLLGTFLLIDAVK